MSQDVRMKQIRSIAPFINRGADPLLDDVINELNLYDFWNDRIVKGKDIPGLAALEGGTFFQEETQYQIADLGMDTYIVLKGIYNPEKDSGGEFIPLVGTRRNMAMAFGSLNTYMMLVQGYSTEPYRPIWDFIAEYDPSGKTEEKIKNMIKRGTGIYSNNTINQIRIAYENAETCPIITTTSTPVVEKASVTQRMRSIQRSIDKYISTSSVINLNTGHLAGAKSKKAGTRIQEMRVTTSSGSTKNVNFAIPVIMSKSEEEMIFKMMADQFGAIPVAENEVSTQARISVVDQPVRLIAPEYSTVFQTTDDFSEYHRLVNEENEVAISSINTPALIYGERKREEVEEEAEFVEEEEEEFSFD